MYRTPPPINKRTLNLQFKMKQPLPADTESLDNITDLS